MIKIYFEGLNNLKQNVAAARLAKDIMKNGIEDVERRARNYPKLEHRVGLEAENGVLKPRTKRLENLKMSLINLKEM
ncbi:hypothetical protein [Helicobacter pylori]|uniref:hypothetical protein n=1 Tax=Helicobacter pylori TaxID=210 RepID=UPI001E4E205E|nr:hypothetical protein [Helicobacter pylori]